MRMSVIPVGQSRANAASGQCLLPEDAFPWLFRRAHTCMLSPLSVCSLTFGTVKIEDTAGRKDANRLEERRGWQGERHAKKTAAPLLKFSFFWGLQILFRCEENVFLRYWVSNLPVFTEMWGLLEARTVMTYSQVQKYCNVNTILVFLALCPTTSGFARGRKCFNDQLYFERSNIQNTTK